MEKVSKVSCLVTTDGWFGKSSYYKHDWEYINKERRICSNCREQQVLFGEDEYREDWRKLNKEHLL